MKKILASWKKLLCLQNCEDLKFETFKILGFFV